MCASDYNGIIVGSYYHEEQPDTTAIVLPSCVFCRCSNQRLRVPVVFPA